MSIKSKEPLIKGEINSSASNNEKNLKIIQNKKLIEDKSHSDFSFLENKSKEDSGNDNTKPIHLEISSNDNPKTVNQNKINREDKLLNKNSKELEPTKAKTKEKPKKTKTKLAEEIKASLAEIEQAKETDIETIDCDTYLCLSVTMPELYIMVITPFLLLSMGWKYIKKYYKKVKNERRTMMIVMLIFSPILVLFGSFMVILMFIGLLLLVIILMLPGLATPIIQLTFFKYIISQVEDDFDPANVDTLLVLKVVVLFVLLFMVTNEATQALNSLLYSHANAINKKLFFWFGCFFPQLTQLLMAFILFCVSIYLIAATSDTIDLIQNFAGLYILLDLDVTIMQFLRTIKFTSLLIIIKKLSKRLLREELEGKEVFGLEFMSEAFEKSSMEIDINKEIQKNPKYKYYQLGLRFCAVVLLMLIGAYVWIYVINQE